MFTIVWVFEMHLLECFRNFWDFHIQHSLEFTHKGNVLCVDQWVQSRLARPGSVTTLCNYGEQKSITCQTQRQMGHSSRRLHHVPVLSAKNWNLRHSTVSTPWGWGWRWGPLLKVTLHLNKLFSKLALTLAQQSQQLQYSYWCVVFSCLTSKMKEHNSLRSGKWKLKRAGAGFQAGDPIKKWVAFICTTNTIAQPTPLVTTLNIPRVSFQVT